jgi:hypothetical protein
MLEYLYQFNGKVMNLTPAKNFCHVLNIKLN